MRGQRRNASGDEQGIEPPADLVGAGIRQQELGGLQGEGVLDGDEVDKAGLGGADGVCPVAGGEQLGGPGRRLPPRGRVPSGPLEGDAEAQSLFGTHGDPSYGSGRSGGLNRA